MGFKGTEVESVVTDICCPFEDVQIQIQKGLSTSLPPCLKCLQEGTEIQVDVDCIYIGGKYKLPWKKVTECQVDKETNTLYVSTAPVVSDEEANASTGSPNVVDYYRVVARAMIVGTDTRRPRTGTLLSPPREWAALALFVEKKWQKKLRRQARREAALLEERQQQQNQTAKESSRAYKKKQSSHHRQSKALQFLSRNAKNIHDWDSDDDQVFNRRPHKELLQKRREEDQDDEKMHDEDHPHHQATLEGNCDNDNDGDMMSSEDLNAETKDDDDSEAQPESPVQAKKHKLKRLKKNRKHRVDGDSDDDENLFDDLVATTTRNLTTPLAKRVVTPGTAPMHKTALEDDDEEEARDEEMDQEPSDGDAKKEKSSDKGPGLISNFFAPRGTASAIVSTEGTAKEEKSNVILSTAKAQKGNNDPKPQNKKATSSVNNFFAPRRSAAVDSSFDKKNSNAKDSLEGDDDDDATAGSTPPPAAHTQLDDEWSDDLDDRVDANAPTGSKVHTPKNDACTRNKSFSSSSSKFAFESAKRLEQEEDPILDFDDDMLASPSNNKSAVSLLTGTSPLSSRLSGQKRRLFPLRKTHYGSKPAPNMTALRALDQAEHQSPKPNPFAGMGSISVTRTKKLAIGSPLSPIRQPLLAFSPASSPARAVAPPPKKWVGLRNLGNTCYINASLQMLYSIPSFTKALLPFCPGHRLVNMLCHTYHNVVHPKEGFVGSASARALKMAVDAKTDKFQGYQQRDAHEFLGHLIDQVHEEIESSTLNQEEESKEEEKKDDGLSTPLLKPKEQTILPTDDFFRMTVEVCLKCKSCGYSRTKEEIYRYLSVDIDSLEKSDQEKPTVKGCLENFFQPEDREIKCEKCDDGTAATQTMFILSLPKALLVHLKRFKVVERPVPRKDNDSDNGPSGMELSFQKNRVQVELTANLSLNGYLSSKNERQSDSLPSQYILKSIVHHIGNTANSGHYTADALRWKPNDGKDNSLSPISSELRDPTTKDPSQPQWVSYDDGATTETTLEDVRGSVMNQRTAYMLLYSTV